MNKIDKIIKESIDKILSEKTIDNREPLMEMATFGVERWGHTLYKIAVHGASTNDRPTPHIHIYLNNDVNPYTRFNFEISLIDILCKNEINLIFQRDRERNIDNRDRNQCSWTGYDDIRKGITEFLFSPCATNRFGDFSDNLERGIFEWNRETDYVKTINEGVNVLRQYFEEKKLTPLPQYAKYLKDYSKN